MHAPLAFPFTIGVALLASYVAYELLRHGVTPGARPAWIATGAVTLGLGIVSVHFVGMLGYRIRSGRESLPIGYELWHILLAALVGTAGAALAVTVASLGPGRWTRRVLAGVILGGAIAGTHFVAMRAVRAAIVLSYAPGLSAAAVAVAVTGGVAMVLWGARRFEVGAARGDRSALAATLLGALVIAGTHFTAMAAVRLAAAAAPAHLGASQVLATDGLAGMVATLTLLLFGFGALSLVLDRQAGERISRMEQFEALYREADAARLAAEESERRFRATADSAPVLIWMTRADGTCEYVNRAWLDYTGLDADRALGEGFFEVVHPSDRSARSEAMARATRGGRPATCEYRLRCHDGTYGWMLETVASRAVRGEPAGHVGSCVDITLRKRAEDAQAMRLDAARELATSLDLDTTLRHVTRLVVPRLADYCIVYLREDDGTYRQAAAEHGDAEKRPMLERLAHLHRPDLANPASPVGRVVTTRQAVLESPEESPIRSFARDADVRAIHAALAPVSYMVLPLVARGELLGTLALVASESGRRYGPDDLADAELLSARAALAIDNARLYAEARRAGEEAVRAAGLEARLIRARLETLRTQLNPHFLFNALNTLAMLVRRSANADALRGIVSLSQLLRHALSDLAMLEVPLRSEISLLENYLEIEQLRFRDRLRVSLVLAPDTLEALVPSLTLQPLVENAIRHGVARRSEAGRVEVQTRRENGHLLLEVRDDGPGFPAGWDAESSGGIGIANTRERLERLYDGQARFEASNDPDGGAVVRVRIPFRAAPPARGAAS